MMSTKATIHQLIDALSDEEADRILPFLRTVAESASSSASTSASIRISESEGALLEGALPIAESDLLWTLVGIIEDGPADLSVNHDKYLAENYGDSHRDK